MEDDDELSTPQTSTNLQNRLLTRRRKSADDELCAVRSYLRWLCLDQSTWLSGAASWLVFAVFGVAVPAVSHFFLACSSCDSDHRRPYGAAVELSLSSVAGVAFVSLARIVRKYGLRKLLFFDKLVNESATVRRNYAHHLNRSVWICSGFTLPCFTALTAYKIWWYATGATNIPFLGNAIISDTVACTLEVLSWLYRTTLFFMACVLFRLICHLQILRLQDFARVFEEDGSDVASVLAGHLSIRRHLRVISHRFRWFILGELVLITISQLVSLMLTTKSSSDVTIFNAGELALCSITLLTGLMILLNSAAKITHKGQAITALAAKWHVCATIDSYNPAEQPRNPAYDASILHGFPHGDSDEEDCEHEEDELDNTRLIPSFTSSSISFQKRQALETYFEHHKAGITVYGFMLDRTSLRLIFGTEMALVLFLLKKTVSIS